MIITPALPVNPFVPTAATPASITGPAYVGPPLLVVAPILENPAPPGSPPNTVYSNLYCRLPSNTRIDNEISVLAVDNSGASVIIHKNQSRLDSFFLGQLISYQKNYWFELLHADIVRAFNSVNFPVVGQYSIICTINVIGGGLTSFSLSRVYNFA